MKLSRPSRLLIGFYLMRVRWSLEDATATERQEVVGDLRAHILEQLREQGNNAIRAHQTRFVIRLMDSPRQYRELALGAPDGKRAKRFSADRLTTYLFLAGLFITIASTALHHTRPDRYPFEWTNVGAIVLVCAMFAGFFSIRKRIGRIVVLSSILALLGLFSWNQLMWM